MRSILGGAVTQPLRNEVHGTEIVSRLTPYRQFVHVEGVSSAAATLQCHDALRYEPRRRFYTILSFITVVVVFCCCCNTGATLGSFVVVSASFPIITHSTICIMTASRC
jgi:hypothetical protein